MKVLVLRPQPGADDTAARARALGLDPVVAPLFAVRPLAWQAPEAARFDAVMLTSGHAARCGGPGLAPFIGLPCYAVGEATAAEAREADFADVRTGPADGAALLQLIASDGRRSIFHPCGRDRIAYDEPGLRISSVPVYAAEPAERLPAEAEAAIAQGAVALLHSPRAAAVFARLARGRRPKVALAAISRAAAKAAGEGWREIAIADRPRDEALLELAASLCQTECR